jgi:HAE1 family hydrophobic/amphiphilic exporter-1
MARRAKEPLNGMPISDLAINQPVFISMMMLLAVVLGLVAYNNRPVEMFPDMSMPVVLVTIPYSGAGPESVAEQVTEPIEDTLNTLSGVDMLTSVSNEGSAQIVVQFFETVDADQALLDVREKVQNALPRLPNDVGDPTFMQFDLNAAPIVQIALGSDGSLSGLELRELVNDELVPRIQRVEGVGDVQVTGGLERQINVDMDLPRLSAYRVAPAQIVAALGTANANLGLGRITTDQQSFSLRTPSQLRSIDDIKEVGITGSAYRIGDVANVYEGVSEAQEYSRLNGADAVSVGVLKRSGSNTLTVGEESLKVIEAFVAENPSLQFVVTSDQSEAIRTMVDGSIEEIILAVIAAFLVVLVFFRDLRNTLTTIAGLPIIMIFTFVALQLFGISINMLSLLALSLSVGLVIDDAIVVRENIFRYAEHGFSSRQAASKGTAQVTLSVVAMTLTIIAVFLPVTFVGGVAGFIFKAFGITVACAMAISLIEAFTFAPMLSSTLFKSKHNDEHQTEVNEQTMIEEGEEEVGAMGRFYGRILSWTLKHRGKTMLMMVGVIVVSIFVARGVQTTFLPNQLQDSFTIAFKLEPGAALARTDALSRQAEEILLQDPDVIAVQAQVGGQGSQESASLTVRITSSKVSEVVRERVRGQLTFLPEMVMSTPSIDGGGGTGVTGRAVQVQIRTSDPLSNIIPVSDQLVQIAHEVPGLVDIGSTFEPGRTEIQFYVPPERARDLGVTNNDIATTVRALINGITATTLRNNGNDTDIVVRLPSNQRADINDIRAITLPTASGNIPLTSIAQIEFAASPTSVRRTNQQNEIVVGANIVPGANVGAVQADFQQRIDALQLPSNVQIIYGGDQADQAEAFGGLFLAMGLSVLFVYMVLASQFGSFMQPFVIMLAMPFSFLGAFAGLSLTGTALDITGMIGLIMLLGLVVKNSILLVDLTNKLREGGMSKHEALEHAGAVRLRPILMTSIAIIAGALPTAMGLHIFSEGEGTEFRRGLATVLIGGMATSTLLTLLIVPTAYSLLEGFVDRFMGLFKRKGKQAAAEPALATAASAPLSVAPEQTSNGNGNGHSVATENETESTQAAPVAKDEA